MCDGTGHLRSLQGNETAAMSAEQLLAAAGKAAGSLPTSTIDAEALANSSDTLVPWQGAGGRKMLAAASFVDICIPVVFHGAPSEGWALQR
jgi:hypothetical protein